MKQTLALLFVSALMVFSLAACGTDSNTNDDMNKSSSTDGMMPSDNGSVNNGSMNESYVEDPVTGAPMPGDGALSGEPGSSADGANSASYRNSSVVGGVNAAAHRVANDVDSAAHRVIDDGEQLIRGASYDQMLRNASVHDSDGFLKDGENAMTPGIKH